MCGKEKELKATQFYKSIGESLAGNGLWAHEDQALVLEVCACKNHGCGASTRPPCPGNGTWECTIAQFRKGFDILATFEEEILMMAN